MPSSPVSQTPGLREYVGAIHIHTRASDGAEKLPSVIRAAQRAGLDFIIVSDHNTLHYLKTGMEGWHGRTAVIVGEEISSGCGHCLALGTARELGHLRNRPQAYIDEIHKQGGVAFVCHPHAHHEPFRPKRNYAWKDWSVEGVDGIEVWSYMYDWKRDINWRNFPSHIFHPERWLKGPDPATLAKWDELARRRPTAGIGSLDAHGRVWFPIPRIKPFSYEQMFRSLRTHLLLPPLAGRFSQDKRVILDGLRRGHGFLALDSLAPSLGLVFELHRYAAQGENPVWTMGQEATFDPPMTLHLRLPRRARIRLVCDGDLLFSDTLEQIELPLERPGVVRMEAYLDGKPWIFTNPIYVRATKPPMDTSTSR